MVEYVAGLLFDLSGTNMAIVEKNRPEWQAGMINAIGGKVEPGEYIINAMEREFREETGIDDIRWLETAVLHGNGWTVNFFHAFDSRVYDVKTMEDERISVNSVQSILNDNRLMKNLKVIIPIALDQSGIEKPVVLYDLS